MNRIIFIGFFVAAIVFVHISFAETSMHLTPAEKMRLYNSEISLSVAFINPQISSSLAMAPGGKHFDLIPYLSYIPGQRNQGICGNCWVWASTACVEIDRAFMHGVKERLSIQLFNSNYNIGYFMPGNKQCWACCGAFASDFAEFYDALLLFVPWDNQNADFRDGAVHCCSKNSISCSYKDKCDCCNGENTPTVNRNSISLNPNYLITSIKCERVDTWNVNKETAIANIKNILNQNKAIVFGFAMTNSSYNNFGNWWGTTPETSVWGYSNLNSGQECPCGHALVCIGYDDSNPNNRYWIMLNSWGTTPQRPNGLMRVSMDMDYSSKDNHGWYNLYWNPFDIKSPRPNGLQNTGKGGWTEGYTSVVSFGLNSGTHLFEYKSGDGTWYISRISTDGKSLTDVSHGKWTTGYTSVVPFYEGNTAFLFEYKSGDGTWYINRISTDGKSLTDVGHGKWTTGYTSVVPFSLNNEPYLFEYKSSDGTWYISRINSDQTDLSDMGHGKWTTGYTSIVPFRLNNEPYLFEYKSSDGAWYISRINTDGRGLTDCGSGNLPSGFTHIVPFRFNNAQYLFRYKSGSGTITPWDITRINFGSSLTANIIAGSWGQEITSIVPFYSGNRPYLFRYGTDIKTWYIDYIKS